MEIRDLVRLRKAKDRMDREFDRPLDVPAVARSAAMSTGHFSRSFKAAFGESPYSYLMTRRIERAKALLRRGDVSVRCMLRSRLHVAGLVQLALHRARRRVTQRLSSAQPLGCRRNPPVRHQGADQTGQK